MSQPHVPNADSIHKQRLAETQHDRTVAAATSRAVESAPNFEELQSKEFIETAFTPEVDRGKSVPGVEDNNLESRFSAEFSRHQGLSNITREDWVAEKWLNRAKAILAKQEYARPSGLGSRCRPDIRSAWTDLSEDLATLDDDLAREISASFEEKTWMQALSIDAQGFRGLTEVTAVNRSEGVPSPNSGNDGIISRFTGGLLG